MPPNRNGPPLLSQQAGRAEYRTLPSATVTTRQINTLSCRAGGAAAFPSETTTETRRVRDFCPENLPDRIRERITVSPFSGCWIGSAPVDRDGYARFGQTSLHRAVWTELVGPVPARRVLDHREDWGCISRACCNPAHLNCCTSRENTLRGNSFAAINARKTRCGACGREFDLFNTYFYRGRRDCRACIRDRVRRYKKRQQGRPDLARAA
jgi:hypothetical protein